MKLLAALCCCVGLALATPLPGRQNGVVDNGEETIDLSFLGESIYMHPSTKTGELVAAWNEQSPFNPEELGAGDILHPPATQRNGLRAESTRWPEGVVPYVIEGSYSSQHRDNIMMAIADYHRLTCIRFVPYTGQKDYITIGNGKTGCWSSVGRIGGRQEVNLQNPGCVTKKGTIAHELMHALGFVHEQSRNERDSFVTINNQNIKNGEEYNFKKSTKDSINDFGVPYDYGSIMHYGEYAFSSNNKPTIVPKKNGVSIGQREGLSKSDVNKLNAMYKCKKEFDLFGALSSLFG